VERVPSQGERFKEQQDNFAQLNEKVDALAQRPVMNGGFTKMQRDMQALSEGQNDARDRAAAAAALAEQARVLAAEAVEAAHAGVREAQTLGATVTAMHLSNIERFNMIDRNLADAEIQRQTHLAALAEDYQINLPSTPTGELHGELHLTLKPETPSD
jgi:prophage DNA circulation protein